MDIACYGSWALIVDGSEDIGESFARKAAALEGLAETGGCITRSREFCVAP